jgi:argininosuccinate lyase
MAKLWQDKNLNKEIERYTVGEDYILDNKLLKYDCIASIAHSKMLKKIGIMNEEEQLKIEKELKNIIELGDKGFLKVKVEDEDCHTLIENYLTEKLGELGKKIHTCRSRNDQVKVALALYCRDELKNVKEFILDLIESLKKLDLDIPIPGYTHYQKAMPSTFSMWSWAFIAAFLDDIKLLDNALEIINQNPLGSGAGYGIPIELDREITCRELGFDKNQEIAYVQNSRGKFEAIILNVMTQIMFDLNKMSSDLIFYYTQELELISLPEELTTGSSIMPQKRNPDVLEIIRGSYSVVLGYEFQVKNIITNLISGYHRDFSSFTKEALMKGIERTKDSLGIMKLVIEGIKINEDKCKSAMTEELFATKKIYELVKTGMTFRDAYKKIKEEINLSK